MQLMFLYDYEIFLSEHRTIFKVSSNDLYLNFSRHGKWVSQHTMREKKNGILPMREENPNR